MKYLKFSFMFVFLFAGFSFSQLKIGYVDSDAIMDNLPDAQDARQKLDQLIQEWQAELTKLENEWKQNFDEYEKRKLIMTDQTRAEMEQKLVQLEQKIAKFREEKFGTNGELFLKQEELMKPVQNRVFLAIEEIAKEEDYDFVFDRSGDIMLLFAKEEYDLTADVLERLKLEKQTSLQIKFNEKMTKKFVSKLPFKLTDSQKKAAWQIIQDIGRNQPMNRLLEGDVGSGKTIVATMAAYLAALNGCQAAFMAPTEILSRQHYEKIWPILKKFDIAIGLLTSSNAKISKDESGSRQTKKELIKKIETGEIPIVIGTHSLIQKNVHFKNLALVVIDEQHRFGVSQRAQLANSKWPMANSYKPYAESPVPHLLSMSATPIPRTLGLTIWGDLDLSLIKEMPKGRKNIITKIVPPSKRDWAYEFIKSEIKKGRQAFIVCPLIEESEKLSKRSFEGIEIKAAKKEQEKLQEKIFPELKIGLLHGRLRPKEKEKVMAEFLNKNLNILVTTSVVEVGVDISNATVMMIEGADRFGLASLYQFRGRVGRSNHQSYCFLLTDSASNKTTERLKAIELAQSGFDLAERDLEIRGPGDFVGVRQSGLPDLAIASLTDLKLIEETREAAKKLLAEDPNLKNYPLLANRVSEFRTQIHFE